jgi:GNAT superfamily N-acetyltransferase
VTPTLVEHVHQGLEEAVVHPDAQRRGRGAALLDAVAADARGLGLEHLLRSVRGGTTLPEFYRRQGWTELGRFPGALRLGPGDVRDGHWFQVRLLP